MSNLFGGDLLLQIQKGNVKGHTFAEISGENPLVNVGSVPEDVINQGGLYEGFDVTSGGLFSIVSTSALDTDGGLGVHNVVMSILDDTFTTIGTEEIPLNGTTPVFSASALGVRTNDVYCSGGGANAQDMNTNNGGNQGTITVTHVPTGFVMAEIPPNKSIAHQICRTVPSDESWFALHDILGVNDNNNDVSAEVVYVSRALGDIAYSSPDVNMINQGITVLDEAWIRIPSGTDWTFRIMAVESNGMDLTIVTRIVKIKNEYIDLI